MNRLRSIKGLLIGAALAAVASGTAWAGLKSNSTVFINTTTRIANGNLGAARNTADAVQYIGCYTNALTGSVSMVCYARDAAGVTVSCNSTSANLLNVVHGLNGDSHLWFSWNTSGACTEVDVYNVSQTPVKNH